VTTSALLTGGSKIYISQFFAPLHKRQRINYLVKSQKKIQYLWFSWMCSSWRRSAYYIPSKSVHPTS